MRNKLGGWVDPDIDGGEPVADRNYPISTVEPEANTPNEAPEEVQKEELPKYLGDPSRRIIYIPAVPSSGTSCIAGILFNLGVNMGKLQPASDVQTRGYYMFEDVEMWQFLSVFNEAAFEHRPIEPNPKEIVLQRHLRIRDYINYRFIMDTENRVGFKAPATFWMLDPFAHTLPIDVIDVHRPLEDAIEADDRTLRTRQERNPDASKPSIHHRTLRAGSLGACHQARNLLCKIHPPKIRLEFYEVLKSPEQHVDMIIEAMDLDPTPEQRATAIGYVNPQMRHV